MPQRPAAAARVLTFEVGGRAFAIEAAAVAEVIPVPPVTRVPQAPPALKGIANVRGRVAPIIAMDKVLDDVAPGRGDRVIMLQGLGQVGLAVDAIRAMREVDTGRAEDGAAAEVIDTDEGPLRLLQLDTLLSRAFTAGFRQRGGVGPAARAAAVPDVEARAPDLAFLQFTLSGQFYATPLEEVRQVRLPPAALQVLPGADAAMLGLMPLRDRLLPVISAASVLGLSPQPIGRASRIVVVAIGEAEAGLLVDEVRGVLRTPADRVGPVPAVLNRSAGEARIDAIARTPGGLVSILAPERVLDEASVATLLAEGAGQAREDDAGLEDGAMQRFLLFRLADETYGLPIDQVDAVIRLPEAVTRVPGAPAFVAGVINHRGRVTPLVDQSVRFATTGVAPGGRRVIVATLGDVTAGFIVDAVEQVTAFPETALQSTPDLAGGEGGVFDRVARIEHEGRLVLLVDPRQLLDQAERDIVRALAETTTAT